MIFCIYPMTRFRRFAGVLKHIALLWFGMLDDYEVLGRDGVARGNRTHRRNNRSRCHRRRSKAGIKQETVVHIVSRTVSPIFSQNCRGQTVKFIAFTVFCIYLFASYPLLLPKWPRRRGLHGSSRLAEARPSLFIATFLIVAIPHGEVGGRLREEHERPRP